MYLGIQYLFADVIHLYLHTNIMSQISWSFHSHPSLKQIQCSTSFSVIRLTCETNPMWNQGY